MCVVSMVYDRFEPLIPYPPWQPTPEPEQVKLLKELIEQFQKAAEAAKVVDRLTGQPDCLDPDKAKLDERVVALEDRIAQLEAAARPRRRRAAQGVKAKRSKKRRGR